MITTPPHKRQIHLSDTKEIPVIVRLLSATPAARTYYKCKSLDIQGQGFVTIDPSQFCSEMGYTRSTLYRHLNNTKLFRNVSKSGLKPRQWIRNVDGTLTAYMNGKARVMALYGHDALGAVFLMSTLELSSPWAIKCRSAEAVVKQGQKQSHYRLAKAFKGKSGHMVIPDFEVVQSYSKKESRHQKDSGFMAGSNEGGTRLFRLHGGQYAGAKSASHNASELDRSVDTLRRYLNNDRRVKSGLEPIASRRLIKKLSDEELTLANSISHFVGEAHNTGLSRNHFRSPSFFCMPAQSSHTRKKNRHSSMMVGKFTIGNEAPTFYQMLPKVYGTDITLLKYRKERRKLFQILEKEQGL